MDKEDSLKDKTREQFDREISRKEYRKIRARRTKKDSIWYGVGMFGIIGWSVSIPILIGVGLGIWIDSRWPGRFSWTLMLLVSGVILGCLNAWYWIDKERKEIEKRDE